MFKREGFHCFLEAPKLSGPRYHIVEDRRYLLNLFYVLPPRPDGSFELTPDGVTSMVSLQIRDQCDPEYLQEARSALEYLANQGDVMDFVVLNHGVPNQALQGDEPEVVQNYAINSFMVYWKPTSKMIMLEFSVQHVTSLLNGASLEAELQIDTYRGTPECFDILDRTRAKVIITNGDDNIMAPSFHPMAKVENLDEYVPLYFKAFLPGEEPENEVEVPALGPISIFVKSDEEKRHTCFICDAGNYQGFFMALCDKYQIDASTIDEVLIGDRYGNARSIDNWAYLNNRHFNLEIWDIDFNRYILLNE